GNRCCGAAKDGITEDANGTNGHRGIVAQLGPLAAVGPGWSRLTVAATFVPLVLGQRVSSMRLVTAAACLCAAGILAACGGGRSSSGPSTTAVPVSVERAVGALQSSHLGICQTSHGGLAPGITVQATSRLEL